MSTRDEILDQIESLQNLLDDGIMDEEQFSAAKDKLLKKLEEIENEEAANHHNDEEEDYRGGSSSRNGGEDDEVDPYDAYGDEDVAGAGAEGDEVVESYLDTHERLLATMKNTKANEQTRWGKSGQIYDENKLTWGSYLDTHEKDSSSRKETKFRSGAQWGKSADTVFDETKLTFGSYLKSEEEKKKKLELEEAKKKMETIDAIKKKKDGEFLDPRNAKFKLEELQGKFPKGVDPTKKELYLSSDDFKKHFGMTLAEYVKLGAFQKKKLKKQLDLF